MISTTSRITFFLADSSGVGVTGVLAANILNGRVQVCKADGVLGVIILSPSNLFEVDSVNQPGIYQVIVSSSLLNVLGKISFTIYPALGATFLTNFVLDEVQTYVSDITLIKKVLFNNELIEQTAGILRLYDDNGIDVIAEWYLQDENSVKSIYNIKRKIRKS